MTSSNLREDGLRRGDEPAELARLRRELDEVRTRLEEETAYYRAELEASRQRLERDSTRLHADEVARRRRVEEQLAALKAELQAVQGELAEARQRNQELSRQLEELETGRDQRARQAVDEVRAAARTAWREAEQEMARQDRELEAVRRTLAGEQEMRQRLQTAVTQLRDDLQRAQQGEQRAIRLVVSLKKALWATAQARRRAETELESLRGVPAAAGPAPRFQEEPYHEVSRDALQTVFFGDLSEDLADEFRLTASDASLDSETVDQLRALAVPAPDPVPAAAEPARQEPAMAAADTDLHPAPVSYVVTPEVRPDGRGRGVRWLLTGLVIVVLAAAVIYWLAANGLLALYWAEVTEALR